MNEEKNLPENESGEEVTEVKESPKKQLPLGALIGIIVGAIAVIAVIVLVIVFAGGNGNDVNRDNGNECDGHVDADDDYLCDKCGEHFDDGDEVVIPENSKINITFTVKLDDGSVLSGVKFILTRGDKTLELTSGADGSVVGSIEAGSYYVTYDSETLPKFCWGETYGVKIEEGTSSVEILIVDNRPDGSENKPYSVSDEATEITVAPGEELYYSCRGTSLRYVTISSENLVVTYNGDTYTAVDGVITVGVSSVDIDTPAVFSVKNISDSTVTATMDVYAPLGSSENPIPLTGNGAAADVPFEGTVYYLYNPEKDGILAVTSFTLGGEILITRNIMRITDGVEEVFSTITAESSFDSVGYIYVTEGNEIKIGVSYVAPAVDKDDSADKDDNIDAQNTDGGEESATNSVEFNVSLYAATEAEPAPISGSNIYIRLDAGASVVFSAETGKTVTVESESSVAVSYNGSNVSIGEDFVLSDGVKFAVTNSSDVLAIFTIKLN